MDDIKQPSLTKKDFLVSFGVIKRVLRPHLKTMLGLGALTILAALADAFIPLLAGRIFDNIIAIGQDPQTALASIFMLIGIWVALQLIADTSNWRINVTNQELGTALMGEYDAKAAARLLKMPIAFHKEHKQGDLSERVQRAARFINLLVSDILVHTVPQLLTVLFVFVVTFLINPILAAVLVVAVLLYIAILLKAIPGLAILQRKINKAYNEAWGDFHESLGNVREIKLATSEEREEKNLFHKFVGVAARVYSKYYKKSYRLNAAQRYLITATRMAIFVISIFLVRDGIITPGELVAFNGYAAMMFGPFVTLGRNWQSVQNGVISMRQSEELLDSPQEVYQPEDAVSLQDIAGQVVFKEVTFGYEDGQTVLNNISFTAEPGQTVALVGESGVGKTTLIDLLLGFYKPEEGTITIDGRDLNTLDLRAYRKKIGVVPQEVTLFNDRIDKNIKYGSFDASMADVKEAAKKAHADEFIATFPKKYKQLVGWRGIKLSTGQKQRVAIARAILQDPSILILDEPTSALDAKSEKYLQESLGTLMEGRTTFVIAHRLSTVRRADQILVLDGGAIVERGTHEELVSKEDGLYRRLYELQIGLHE